MKLSTQNVTAASAGHPWRTIGAWIVTFVLAIAAIGLLLGDSLTTEGAPTNNPESERAIDAIARAFPPDPETHHDGRRRSSAPRSSRWTRRSSRRSSVVCSKTSRRAGAEPGRAPTSPSRARPPSPPIGTRRSSRSRSSTTPTPPASSRSSRPRARTPPSTSRSPETRRSTTTSTSSRRRISRRASCSSGSLPP